MMIDFLHNLLSPFDPIEKIIDFESFSRDPSDYLKKNPIVFEAKIPTKLWGAAPIMVLLIGGVLLYMGLTLMYSAIIASAIGVAALLSFVRPGWKIVFQYEGVEFFRGHRSIFCPWAVFDVQKDYIATNSLLPLIFPLRSSLYPLVESRQHSVVVDCSDCINSWQIKFPTHTQAFVYGYYRVDPRDFAHYLFNTAQLLQTESPAFRTALPIPADTKREAEKTKARYQKGWLYLDFHNLSFPEQCCSCLSRDITWTIHKVQQRASIWTIFHVLLPLVDLELTVSVPVCKSCKRRRIHICAITATLFSVLSTIGVSIIAWRAGGFGSGTQAMFGSLTAICITAFCMAVFPLWIADTLLRVVRIVGYTKSTMMIKMKFMNKDYNHLSLRHNQHRQGEEEHVLQKEPNIQINNPD